MVIMGKFRYRANGYYGRKCRAKTNYGKIKMLGKW